MTGEGPTVAMVTPQSNATISDIVCHFCKAKGHRAVDCPNGAQKLTVNRTMEQKKTTDQPKNSFNKNKSVKCIVCGKIGHTITNCWSHQKSCSIIKSRLLRNKKSVPKEIFTVLADPEILEELHGVFSDTEDWEAAVCASLQAMDFQEQKEGGEDI